MFGVEKTATPPGLEDTINLANNLAIVFQMPDCFDAGYQREAIVAVRKHLPV
jgi:hypothetical protein